MAEELISDLVDEPRISKQLTDVISGIERVKKGILDVNKLGREFTFGGSGNSSSLKEGKKALDELARAELNLAKASGELGQKLAVVRTQTNEVNKQNRAAAKEALGLVDAYARLGKEYALAARSAKNMAIVYGETDKRAVEAAKHANNLGDQLKRIDATVGQYGRNVGNYTSATAALNQVLREAPSLAINFQTFALAISNNLPILFDEFNKLSKAVDANTGKINGAGKAFKTLATSLFSAGSILTIGITLFTLYSKEISEFFSELFKGAKVIDVVRANQESFNKTVREGVKDIQDEIIETKRLFTVAKDVTQPMEARKQAIKDIKKEYPEYARNLKDEAFLTGQATEAYNKIVGSLQAVAKTRALMSRMSDNAAKDLDLEAEENKLLLELEATRDANNRRYTANIAHSIRVLDGGFQDEIRAQNRLNEVQEKRALIFTENALLERKINKDTTDLTNKYYKDLDKNKDKLAKKEIERQKALLEAQRIALEGEAEKQKAIFENERLSYDQRSAALDAFTTLQTGIAQKNREIALLEAKGVAEEVKKADEQYKKDNIESDIQFHAELLEILKDYLSEDQKLVLNANEKKKEELSKQETAEREQLLSLYKAKNLTTEQYEAERLRIENKYSILRLQSEADALDRILRATEGYGLDTTQIEEKLLEARQKIRDLDLDYQEKAEKEKNRIAEKGAKERAKTAKKEYEELSKQIQQAIKQFNDIAGPILDIISNKYEAQKNFIQDQIDLIDERAQTEIDAVNRSTASEQEKADKIAVIEATANARKKALEREQRRIAQEQARFDKAKAIFDIVANTAVNVVKFLGVPVLAALAAAVGAAQLAAVASRPIPRYKGGRKGGPAEFAYVGDGGVSEVVEYGGRAWVTPRRPTLTYLPADANVYKSVGDYMAKDSGMSATPSILKFGNSGSPINTRALEVTMNRGNQKIVSAINRSRVNVIVKNGAFYSEAMASKGIAYTNYVNDNFRR